MEFEKLLSLFAHSPTLHLLRANNAPFIIHFLHEQFRVKQRITVRHDHVRTELIAYQDWLRQHYPDKLTNTPDAYLNEWCGENARILLRRFESGPDSLVYQLTASAETVLRFIEENLEREARFVGTESRIRYIVETLREIAINASDDPERHIAELERERERIESRIAEIRRTGDVRTYHETQLRERFFNVVETLSRVLSDFRQVEETFREITREVQQRDARGGAPKGDLLGFALGAEDQLRESDQGVSFYGFVDEILVPARQERLRELIAEVRHLKVLAEHEQGLQRLRHMMPRLTAEADQVMRTVQRLSASIRRFLDAREAGERRQISKLINEIRQMARRCADQPPEDFSIEFEHRCHIGSPATREFWVPPARIEASSLTVGTASSADRDEAFAMFAQMQRLDWERMRAAIESATRRGQSVSLPRLLAEFPPKSGAVEVLGYLQIAKDDDHLVAADKTDEIILPPGGACGGKRLLRVPKVIFQPKVDSGPGALS